MVSHIQGFPIPVNGFSQNWYGGEIETAALDAVNVLAGATQNVLVGIATRRYVLHFGVFSADVAGRYSIDIGILRIPLLTTANNPIVFPFMDVGPQATATPICRVVNHTAGASNISCFFLFSRFNNDAL